MPSQCLFGAFKFINQSTPPSRRYLLSPIVVELAIPLHVGRGLHRALFGCSRLLKATGFC